MQRHIEMQQRRESTVDLLGSAFRSNAWQKNISDARIEACEALITKATGLLLKNGQDKWSRFNGLRALLSSVREWQVEDNFNGYTALESWLRYQLVSVFRKILACETLFQVIDDEKIIRLANFKDEFDKIASNDDYDGVRKDICDDFIYRCALPTLQGRAKELKSDVSIELMLHPEFPDSSLKSNVTIPLMIYENGGMPYFTRATTQDTMMDPSPKKINQTPESYADQGNKAREKANNCVKDILTDRIKKFGISDPLSPVLFAAFYQSRHPSSEAVASIVEPVQENHSIPWKKIVSIGALALVGAAVGALVAYFSMGIAAVAAAAAIGFGAGLLLGGLGWAASKWFRCCHAPATQVISDEKLAGIELGVSSRHNLNPSRFCAPEKDVPAPSYSQSDATQSRILSVVFSPFDEVCTNLETASLDRRARKK